jgi:hypothetical protein
MQNLTVVPRTRGDPYAVASRFGTVANAFCSNWLRWLWVRARARGGRIVWCLRTTQNRHTPRKRGIQYAAAFRCAPDDRLRVLRHIVKTAQVTGFRPRLNECNGGYAAPTSCTSTDPAACRLSSSNQRSFWTARQPLPSAEIKNQTMLPKIYSDFNNKDELHRVRLNLARSKTDIENSKEKMTSGAHVLLYVEGEFEVEAVLDFDAKYNLWVASPIYSTIVYRDG